MNKPLNDALAEIRQAIMSAHRDGYGRETDMSPDEISAMDDIIRDATSPVLELWMKVKVGRALELEEWMKAAQEEE